MEQFKCPVCANHYSQANPPRLLTMCGHTYCHNCIKHLIKRKDNRFFIRCPEDRQTITIDIASPSHFPKNIALLEAFRRRNKDKDDTNQQHNEFLACSAGTLKKGNLESRSNMSEFRQAFLGQRRTSIEEGMCLLHRKPLDIVCVQEKIHICAECALFGLHKGHSFTTLKDLNSKNKAWSSQINEIIEEKKHIDTKVLNGEIQKQLVSILHKKKDLMLEEIDAHIKRLKQKIDEMERVSKEDLQSKLERLQAEVKLIPVVDPKVEQDFNVWTEQVQERCHFLQQNSHQSIMILSQSDQKLCESGQVMLQNIKNQLVNFWSKIESALQYPKVRLSSQTEKLLESMITIDAFDCSCLKGDEWQSMERTKQEDFSMVETNKNQSILNEVSLLDISANAFRFEEEHSAIEISRISQLSNTIQSPKINNLQKSQVSIIRKMKRAKSKQLDLNMSLITSLQSKTSLQSPKHKQKTMIFSKKSISSPITPTPKARLRKFVLKVKQPQKFDKIVTGLESDSINSVDLTGFEIGDQGAKQLCLKVVQCKKPRLLRLMKNSLTDQSIKEVVDTLKVIDYLNLAQNNFTQKILDYLLQTHRRQPASKGKTIQLGQNQLNSRKLKQKIDQLKKLGVMITL